MTTLVRARRRPALPNADEQHAADGRRRRRHALAWRDAGTETRGVEAVQLRCRLGADVNAVDNNGETAMHGAAYKNLPWSVQFLADKGAKIDVWNQPEQDGWTPLMIAAGYRFGNFKPSPRPKTAIREVMIAAGVTPPETVEPEWCRSTRSNHARSRGLWWVVW